MPDSPTTAMNVQRMMTGDDDFSRRSSLRSQSIYDYDGSHEAGKKFGHHRMFTVCNISLSPLIFCWKSE